MRRKRFVLFSIVVWLFEFAFLAAAAWAFYYGATKLQYDKQIIAYVCGVLVIAFVVGHLNETGGFLIIDESRILVRQKLFNKTRVMPVNDIHMLYLCGKNLRVSLRGAYVIAVRANTEDGPILGLGFHAIRALVKHLNVPVHISEYTMSVTMNAKVLLQKGKLSDYQAKMLMATSSWPKKYLNKWYDERQQ